MNRTLAILCVAALAAACQDRPEPTAPVERTAGLSAVDRHAIPGQYIVQLRDEILPAQVPAVAHAMAQAGGGRIERTYSAAIKGFLIATDARRAAALARDPRVLLVEADQEVWAVGSGSQSPVTWGLDRIDQRDLPLSDSYGWSTDGSGVTAYIIDTGIRVTHSEFGGRATPGFDAVTSGGTADDCNGHGTHVAGTVGGATYGVAKNVTLIAVRVLNCAGSGSTSGVIAGIDWVTAHHESAPAVANMSLGGGASTALDNAVTNSINDGISYAVAAGNDGTSACTQSPARVPTAITVGATSSSDARASWSNYGSCLDLFAPGVSITSAWKNNDSSTNTISGTSMASPHVAGAAALWLDGHASDSPTQVRDAVVGAATSGKVSSAGSGSPNLLLYTGTSSSPPPPPPPPPPPSGGPVASIAYSCSDFTCDFDGNGSTGATGWSWAFGDGGTASGSTASHTYGDRGNYTVTLTVTDGSGSDTASTTVRCNKRNCR